jgi:hypothetical protein
MTDNMLKDIHEKLTEIKTDIAVFNEKNNHRDKMLYHLEDIVKKTDKRVIDLEMAQTGRNAITKYLTGSIGVITVIIFSFSFYLDNQEKQAQAKEKYALTVPSKKQQEEIQLLKKQNSLLKKEI